MANYDPLHRNIEDLKEKNSQIGRVEETVGLIWCVSKEFKYKFVFLFISHVGFNSGIWLLIAPVPVHCFSITFGLFCIITCD